MSCRHLTALSVERPTHLDPAGLVCAASAVKGTSISHKAHGAGTASSSSAANAVGGAGQGQGFAGPELQQQAEQQQGSGQRGREAAVAPQGNGGVTNKELACSLTTLIGQLPALSSLSVHLGQPESHTYLLDLATTPAASQLRELCANFGPVEALAWEEAILPALRHFTSLSKLDLAAATVNSTARDPGPSFFSCPALSSLVSLSLTMVLEQACLDTLLAHMPLLQVCFASAGCGEQALDRCVVCFDQLAALGFACHFSQALCPPSLPHFFLTSRSNELAFHAAVPQQELVVGGAMLTKSRADAPCKWRSLLISGAGLQWLCPSTLAYLPLHSLTQVGKVELSRMQP